MAFCGMRKEMRRREWGAYRHAYCRDVPPCAAPQQHCSTCLIWKVSHGILMGALWRSFGCDGQLERLNEQRLNEQRLNEQRLNEEARGR